MTGAERLAELFIKENPSLSNLLDEALRLKCLPWPLLVDSKLELLARKCEIPAVPEETFQLMEETFQLIYDAYQPERERLLKQCGVTFNHSLKAYCIPQDDGSFCCWENAENFLIGYDPDFTTHL